MTSPVWQQPPTKDKGKATDKPEVSRDELAILMPPIPLAKVANFDVEGKELLELINTRKQEYYDYLKKACDYLRNILTAVGENQSGTINVYKDYIYMQISIRKQQTWGLRYFSDGTFSCYDENGYRIASFKDGGQFPLKYGKEIRDNLERCVRDVSEYAKSLL